MAKSRSWSDPKAASPRRKRALRATAVGMAFASVHVSCARSLRAPPCLLQPTRFGGTLPKPVAIATRFYVVMGLLCAATAATEAAQPQGAPEIPRFSAGKGEGLPAGWEHVPLASYKA